MIFQGVGGPLALYTNMHSMIKQHIDACEAQTRNPSVSSWTTAHSHKTIKIV